MVELGEPEGRALAGDPAGQFTLARTLLSTSGAGREDFSRAVTLIDSAAAAGYARATEMRALFAATGLDRPPSWDQAFDTLQLAAEQGSSSAARQLLLLSDNSRDPIIPERLGATFWRDTREHIVFDKLLHHADRRALCDAPRIRVIEGFASPAECRWLIDRARTALKPSLVLDASGEQVVDPGRTNRGMEFQLPDMDLVLEVIRTRISSATRIPVPVFEPTQLLHYEVGQEFKHHRDFLDPANPHHMEQVRSDGQRIATFLIYLNSSFEGGETEFPKAGVRFRGKTGDALFWANVDIDGRPDEMTLHAGLPPTSGEKWLLSQWIRDRTPPAR